MDDLAHLYARMAREWVTATTDNPREVFRCAVGWTDEDWKLVVKEREARLDALRLLAQDVEKHETVQLLMSEVDDAQ